MTAVSDADEDEVADGLFKFIGQYIVFFQQAEYKIEDIIMLAIGRDRHYVGQILTSRMSHREKLEAARTIMNSSPVGRDPSNREWLGTFDSLISAMIKESERRNLIVHSQYLFDFIKIGYPPLHSKLKTNKSGIRADHTPLDKATQDSILGELAELMIAAGFAHTQVIHWSEKFSMMGKPEAPVGEA